MMNAPSKRNIHTITAAEMRAINRSSILELIRSSETVSRSQIAEDLEVSLPTVMRIVDELIAEGLVVETGQKEWSGGRKRTLLKFNGENHLILGVDLGGTKIYGAVANLNGEIVHEVHFTHGQSQAEESLGVVCQVIDSLLAFTRTTPLPVRGIGIGVPGVVQAADGNVILAPALGWTNFPLRQRLAGRYTHPTTIENDVNLAALGEMWFGTAVEINNLILLAVGTGIGAGVVINGSVYGGAHHMAGEVGYFLPDRSHLGKSYPGFGALEQLASGTGIAERGRAALQGTRPPGELESLTAEDVFNAARRGEPWAAPVLQDTVDYLAQLVAALTLIFDPDAILLGGGVAKSADLLIDPILARLAGAIPLQPKLQASQLGYRAAVMGAVVQVLRFTSDYYSVQRG
jgi:glucokinase